MPLSGVFTPPVEVNVDRPFIFAIRDREEGVPLFYGRVVNPTRER